MPSIQPFHEPHNRSAPLLKTKILIFPLYKNKLLLLIQFSLCGSTNGRLTAEKTIAFIGFLDIPQAECRKQDKVNDEIPLSAIADISSK